MKRAEKSKKSTTQIIQAAIKLYSKAGGPDISVNQLCRENNISKGKFYHYFSSKDDLLAVCGAYIVDDMRKGVENYIVDTSKPLAENLKSYYAARIDYWLGHTDYFMLAYTLLESKDYEFRKQFKPLRDEFDECLKENMMEILKAANVKKNISDSELLEVLKVVYDNMFLNDMYKMVASLLKGDIELAKKLNDDLVKLYTKLINVLLYGILSEKAPRE